LFANKKAITFMRNGFFVWIRLITGFATNRPVRYSYRDCLFSNAVPGCYQNLGGNVLAFHKKYLNVE